MTIGVTYRHIIEELAGGALPGRRIKAPIVPSALRPSRSVEVSSMEAGEDLGRRRP